MAYYGFDSYKLRWTSTVEDREPFAAFAPSPAGRESWIAAVTRSYALRLAERLAPAAPPAESSPRPARLPLRRRPL